MNTCVPNHRHRLGNLPSVPAIRKRLEQLRGGADDQLTTARALQILRLDPPAVLRAVDHLSAPIAAERPTSWTVEQVAMTLGPARTAQTLAATSGGAPAQRAEHAQPHQLWLHAIATAHAAHSLAAATGLMDPDEAYLAGLVHDLPRWLPADHAYDVSGLPASLTKVIEACQSLAESGSSAAAADEATVVIAAELLAELAGFAHPDQSATQVAIEDHSFALLGPSQLAAADNLREQVQDALVAAGLEAAAATALAPDWGFPLAHQDARPRSTASEEAVQSLADQRFDGYREILEATAKAAMDHLDFERVVTARWVADTGQLVVDNLAADDHRQTFVVAATEHERQAVTQAVAGGRPAHLATSLDPTSDLLRLLRSEEVLAVPINQEFQVPTLLLLDRALSRRPLHGQLDGERANTLGRVTTLLTENLLLARQRQRAQQFALTDALTRLYNRRVGVANLDQEIARCQRTQSPLTILMIDLDDFKGLNDTYGHLQGDHALRATAEVLRRTMRRGDTVCRYGGEEFLVVLPSTKADEAAILAARLFTAIEERGQQIELPLTVSIGLAALRAGDTIESCLQRADQALYASKSLGRNRFSVDAEPD